MKAIAHDRYGSPDVLELKELDRPTLTKDRVLLRVHAAATNPFDWHIMRGRPLFVRMSGTGLFRPKSGRPGHDVAGTVEAVGANVTRFKPGDAVFGWAPGAFAEYARPRETTIAPKPANLTFEQAAALPVAAATALQGVRDHGRVQAGERVLVIGASGGVGSFAVQIARSLGAEVTGVCSTRNLELVRSIGADHVIDYTREDFTRLAQRYDVILQFAGTASPWACRRALTPNGRLVLSSGMGRFSGIDRILGAAVLSRFGAQRMGPYLADETLEDLLTLKDLAESGAIVPVIDRTYPLAETPDAIRYLEAGHTQGKVVITV